MSFCCSSRCHSSQSATQASAYSATDMSHANTMTPSTGNVAAAEPIFCKTGVHLKNPLEAQPELQRRGTIVHGLKRLFHRAPKHTINATDPDYVIALNNFNKLTELYTNLRVHLANWVSHTRGLLVTSNTVASDLVLACDDNFVNDSDELTSLARSHEIEQGGETSQTGDNSDPTRSQSYSRMITLVRAHHDNAHAVRAAQLADQLERSSILILEKQLATHALIAVRVAHRDKLRSSADYYTAKVDKLSQERLATTVFTEKQRLRYERNVKKLEESRSTYNNFNMQLLLDLEYQYRLRIGVLGTALHDFVATEAELAQIVTRGTVRDQAALDDMARAVALYKADIDELKFTAEKKAQVEHLKYDDNQAIVASPGSMLTESAHQQSVFNTEAFMNELRNRIANRQHPTSAQIDADVASRRPVYETNSAEKRAMEIEQAAQQKNPFNEVADSSPIVQSAAAPATPIHAERVLSSSSEKPAIPPRPSSSISSQHVDSPAMSSANVSQSSLPVHHADAAQDSQSFEVPASLQKSFEAAQLDSTKHSNNNASHVSLDSDSDAGLYSNSVRHSLGDSAATPSAAAVSRHEENTTLRGADSIVGAGSTADRFPLAHHEDAEKIYSRPIDVKAEQQQHQDVKTNPMPLHSQQQEVEPQNANVILL